MYRLQNNWTKSALINAIEQGLPKTGRCIGLSPEGPLGLGCAYLSAEGKNCAVGALLNFDEMPSRYFQAPEEGSVNPLDLKPEVNSMFAGDVPDAWFKLGGPPMPGEALRQMQIAHDNSEDPGSKYTSGREAVLDWIRENVVCSTAVTTLLNGWTKEKLKRRLSERLPRKGQARDGGCCVMRTSKGYHCAFGALVDFYRLPDDKFLKDADGNPDRTQLCGTMSLPPYDTLVALQAFGDAGPPMTSGAISHLQSFHDGNPACRYAAKDIRPAVLAYVDAAFDDAPVADEVIPHAKGSNVEQPF